MSQEARDTDTGESSTDSRDYTTDTTDDEDEFFTNIGRLSFGQSPRITNLVRINDYEFVGASLDDLTGFYKYNTLSNKWTLIMEYPVGFESSYHQICYDERNRIIYLYGLQKQLVIFRLNTFEIEIIETEVSAPSEASLFIMDSHIVLLFQIWEYICITLKYIDQFQRLVFR